MAIKRKAEYESATIRGYCKTCGWPVVDMCCNGDVNIEPYCKWDWWLYCSNPTCENHKGEGVFQNDVKWWEKE